jgi:hypothetical protein
MSKNTIGALLLALMTALVVSGLVTLLPSKSLIKNDLGYFSLCPFAPWSTLILLGAAGVLWMIRGYLLTRSDE